MNIDEAIRRTSYIANIEDFKSVVEWYIRESKGLDVKIDLYTDSIIGRGKINPILFNIHVKKLLKAYSYALDYYRNNYK